jgi:hypothetical protein
MVKTTDNGDGTYTHEIEPSDLHFAVLDEWAEKRLMPSLVDAISEYECRELSITGTGHGRNEFLPPKDEG